MRTYEDYLKAGESIKDKMDFFRGAVEQFRASRDFENALAGSQYYNKHNTTIEKYQKFLYTVTGAKREDLISANYKLKTLFFRRLVVQQVQYVLGNGATFQEASTKEKLGKDFDFQLQRAAKTAMAQGRSFGFWNLDHLEVFGYADTPAEPGFCPLYGEKTSKLMAGIRYWFHRVDDKHTEFRVTFFEEDGYTEYKQVDNEEPVEVMAKRGYVINKNVLPNGVVEDSSDENYGRLPIITLYANDSHESELVGIRECIDCYDFIKSGLANQIDDTSGIYWILNNTGGMDDVDLANFLYRLKTVRAATVDSDAGTSVTANTVEIPVEARQTMLEILRSDIYEDFQALDVKTLSAAAKTTQEIQAAYQSQDNKCADFEYYIIDFVQEILGLAGIDDNPTFIWNRVVNQQEQTQTVLSAANYLPEDILIKHLPFLTPEEAEMAIEERKDSTVSQFFKEDEADGNEPPAGEEDGANGDEAV